METVNAKLCLFWRILKVRDGWVDKNGIMIIRNNETSIIHVKGNLVSIVYLQFIALKIAPRCNNDVWR